MTHLGKCSLLVLSLLLPSCSAQEGRREGSASPVLAPVVASSGPQAASSEPPSVVQILTTDPALLLGEYELSKKVPPVVDGDTIRVDGLDKSLRLVGLDTEEVFKDDEGLKRLAQGDWPAYLKKMNEGVDARRPPKYGTPMGEASKAFAQEFFGGITTVRLEYDHPKKKRGYYLRHLVHILVKKDGKWWNYNVEAVRQGHTPYFVKYGKCHRYHDAFVAAEKEARAEKRGIWGTPPAHSCYPDYPARLTWWTERAAALDRMHLRKAANKSIFVLDDDEDYERLKTMDGKRVTVAGSLDGSRLIRKETKEQGAIGILYMAHKMNDDFALVGPFTTMEAHPIRSQDGNLILVTGTISIHRGSPQFAIDGITYEVL